MKESERFKPIRPFTREDIPQVAEMYQRYLMNKETPSRRFHAPAKFAEFVEQSVFLNPGYDEEIPPLVAQDSGGKIIGFIATISRRMLLRGQPIRMAVSFNFMVERESRSSLAAFQLLKAFFAGPQDLSFTDSSGDVGRRVWVGAGGSTALLYSLCWTRLLRPSQFAVNLIGKKIPFLPLSRMLGPVTRISDLAVSRMIPDFFTKPAPENSREEMTTEAFVQHISQLMKDSPFRPHYDEALSSWLFDQLGQLKFHGALKKMLVRNQKEEVIGSYIYYLAPGAEGTVLQIAARQNAFADVLDHLFDHSRRQGAVSMIGKAEPQHLKELTERQCHFRHEGTWTLMHSRNPELLHLIHRGEAVLSKLEGDLCVQF